MSTVFSTAAGATVTYLSSTWPWSPHSSSGNMTFWNDLLSAFTQLSLFSSSTAATSTTLPVSGSTLSTTTAITPTITSNQRTTAEFYHALKPLENAGKNLKQSINQWTHKNALTAAASSATSSAASVISTTMASDENKMLNLTNIVTINETLLLTANHYGNFSSDGIQNSLVECNDFTEQKLLNIVICSITDVNNNLINGSAMDSNSSSFNETFRNVSDDFRIYNGNSYFNGTDVTGNEWMTRLQTNCETSLNPTFAFLFVSSYNNCCGCCPRNYNSCNCNRWVETPQRSQHVEFHTCCKYSRNEGLLHLCKMLLKREASE